MHGMRSEKAKSTLSILQGVQISGIRAYSMNANIWTNN